MSPLKNNADQHVKHAITCPCGGKTYDACCKPWHSGAYAHTAEQLMRARYSAYAMGLTQYLLDTWHPNTRPQTLNLSLPEYAGRWLGLDVQFHRPQGNHAEVQFVARFKPTGGGPAQRIHELSHFVYENHQWFYVDGQMPDGQ